jgi:photosystem II stability/assembly factor-like uncharacterized protein
MKKYILFILLVTVFSQKGKAQWIQLTSGTANDLYSIYFPSSTTGYIADLFGHVFKTIDGTSWNMIPGVNNVNGSLFFTSIDTGYAAGTSSILKTTDGGVTWTNHLTESVFAVAAIQFVSSNVGYAAALNNTQDSTIIYKTSDAGITWVRKSTFSTFNYAQCIYFSSPMVGLVLINGEGIYKTTDGGANWLLVSSDMNLLGMHFPSPSIGYAVGMDIYKTTDGGNTWNIQTNPNPTLLYSVFFTSNTVGYAVGGNGLANGEIIKTIDGGINWTLSLANTYTYGGIHFPNSGTGYVCGTGGAIFKLSTTTEIENNSLTSQLNVYPNPSNGIFTIQLSAEQQKSAISVYDILGNNIMEKATDGIENYKIDISNQSKGMYYIKVESEKSIHIQKVIYQ